MTSNLENQAITDKGQLAISYYDDTIKITAKYKFARVWLAMYLAT